MAAVLTVGVVTPVFSNSGSDLALERAKKAKKIAKSARETANQALTTAQQAGQSAQRANDRLDELRIQSASQAGTVSTSSDDYQDLGGPALTVTVPDSGLVELWAEAAIGSEVGGSVSLFMDGQPHPDQSEFCGTGDAGEEGLFMVLGSGNPGDPPWIGGTPTTPGAFSCGSEGGSPGSVLIEAPAGQHTFDLRYATCGCPGTAEFSDRVLRIAPRP